MPSAFKLSNQVPGSVNGNTWVWLEMLRLPGEKIKMTIMYLLLERIRSLVCFKIVEQATKVAVHAIIHDGLSIRGFRFQPYRSAEFCPSNQLWNPNGQAFGWKVQQRGFTAIMKKTCPDDLWIYVEDQDVVDMENVSSEKLRWQFVYISKLPPVVLDFIFIYFDSNIK
ncbi:hypothetical protein Zm00014a_040706 [Zea mays]|uniref:Uncharacterized protein n=1 Tax=Zea mays TaxID=4577 RepID=A0A3L6GEB0_MAIZE|nr:hypothetical protein ZEAMMB73_Zm00001d000368 [Zea mays]PWZ46299.1 hypothetical protein Zm00014a_040706 [Zea mays]